jgi:sigma-B regulation protein RsbU (phosphoserine phosphatase)
MDLGPGDVLVFYTDGVTEAENRLGEEFGLQRLSAVVRDGSSLPAKVLASAIFDKAADFSSEVGFYDDVTILVVKCLFGSSSTLTPSLDPQPRVSKS